MLFLGSLTINGHLTDFFYTFNNLSFNHFINEISELLQNIDACPAGTGR